ncbi:hypothetical protein ACFQGX_09075 [Nonomuraea dietziae]|uniref:hypothetical protein n=1 Tax=Nonomuraea dietziae TaxID=65515 RepID=UPI00360E2A60
MPSRSASPLETSASAAAWSTSMTATVFLVYGQPTKRLPGPGVTSSDGVCAVRCQAWGLTAATSVKGANSSPLEARSSAIPSRRAVSMIA